MDVNRLRFGEMIAAACAAVLFLVMWLPWYSSEVTVPAFGGGTTTIGGNFNAWESYSWIDLLMFLTIIVAIGLAVLTMTQRTVALPLSASVIVTALGGLCALLVLLRIIDQPGPNDLISVKFGAYLGFLLCGGIAFGGYMSMRDEGSSFGSAAKRIQAGMAAASATPQRPAPPPSQPQGPPAPGQPFQPQQPPPAAPPGPGFGSGDPLQPRPPQPQPPQPQQPGAAPGVPPHGTPPAPAPTAPGPPAPPPPPAPDAGETQVGTPPPPPLQGGGETRISPRPPDAPPPEDPPPGSSS